MSGSHYAPEPQSVIGYSAVDDWAIRHGYDLTPPDALHPLTDIAALRLEVAALADALNYANTRGDALERRVKALEDAPAATPTR